MVPGRADGRGQDRQFRRHLCRRLHEAQVDSELDYSDYAYFYDELPATAPTGTTTTIIRSTRTSISSADDSYKKHVARAALHLAGRQAPALVAGLFYQRQTTISSRTTSSMGSPTSCRSTGTDNIWLTKQLRVDRDYAAFGELTFDITPS